MKTSIITIANQKGGVGKTATAVNLATAFAKIGKKTLLIDFDYQGNASSYLGLKNSAKQNNKTISNAILGEKTIPEVACTFKSMPNLQVVCGDMKLTKISRQKILEPGSAHLLQICLEESKDHYEIIIIDTHPSLDLLFQMAMTASHYYLVPMFAEPDPFDGLQYMFEEINEIKKCLNKQLFFLGLVITKFIKSNATHKIFLEKIKQFSSSKNIEVCGVIPNSDAIAGSTCLQQPLLISRPGLPVTEAHEQLAKSLLPQLKGPRMGRTQKAPTISNTPSEISNLFVTENLNADFII